MSALLPSTPQGASTGAELVTTDGRVLPLVATTLRAEAGGGIARFVLEQTFRNHHAETLHVTYRMPLPADGAVSGYAFEIGGRTITGTVDRKAAARERFEQAIVSGRTAALLEQERADIFTQRLGNLPGSESVIARITVDARLVWLPEGEWELRFPTVIGPRYIGSADTVADAHATHLKVTERPLGVIMQLALSITDAITGGRAASSPSHSLARAADGVLALGAGARLDRDLVVRWPVAAREVGLALAAAHPADSPEAFGLLTIVPPARASRPVAGARARGGLLDTSGSMGGGPLDKAKQVVAMLIDSLSEQDRFELIEFSSQPRRYRSEPEVATAQARAAAIQWVRSRRAEGGTEMREAVSEALCTLRIGAQRQVVLVTDGYIGGEQQILDVLHARLPRSCRLHVLGVGSAVNRALATALARAGRGAEVIVGIDEDAERGAKRLLDRTRLPMLTNVEIMGSALIAHAPEHVPDVFEGAPLVAALALRPDGGELVVRGEIAGDTWEQRIRVPAQAAGAGNQAIAALYGRERVADLEAHALLDRVDADIEAIGLRFQIATRLTSWIAVDDSRVIATGPARSELVPQELPYGTRAASFGVRSAAPAYPQQASYAQRAEAAPMAGSVDRLASISYAADVGEDDGAEFSAGERAQAAPRSAAFAPSAPRGMPPTLGSAAPRSYAPPTDRSDDADEFLAEEPTGRAAAPGAVPAMSPGRAAAPPSMRAREVADEHVSGGSPPAVARPAAGPPASPAASAAPPQEGPSIADERRSGASSPAAGSPAKRRITQQGVASPGPVASSRPAAVPEPVAPAAGSAAAGSPAKQPAREMGSVARIGHVRSTVQAPEPAPVVQASPPVAPEHRARKAGPASPRAQRLLAWYSVLFYLALLALLIWWLVS